MNTFGTKATKKSYLEQRAEDGMKNHKGRMNSRGWREEIDADLEEVMKPARKNPEITWDQIAEDGGVA